MNKFKIIKEISEKEQDERLEEDTPPKHMKKIVRKSVGALRHEAQKKKQLENLKIHYDNKK